MSGALAVNAGSSSVKYELLDADSGEVFASGLLERIGQDEGELTHRAAGSRAVTRAGRYDDHGAALQAVLDVFAEEGPDLNAAGIVVVGHRAVQGGRSIDGPRLVTDDLVAEIERLSTLAPLHNPANAAAMKIARELLPDVPHVAVFDTAFFHGLPEAAATYALDGDVAKRHGIRRYGMHGTSHEYVSGEVARILRRGDLRQIVLHLGNGASASAVVGGQPIDTSMGFTPLEGLVMGTRTGDLDPAIAFHLARVADMSVDDIDELMNRRSGLLGLTGANDMRDVLQLVSQGNGAARLGLDVYLHRLRHYIGAYAAVMGGLDAVTFTAGVGENAAPVRAGALQGLEFLGVRLDRRRNERGEQIISTDDSPVTVLVVPTHEELHIARQAMQFV